MIAPAGKFALAIALFLPVASGAVAQELPPIPATLMDAAGIICINVSKEGGVNGAYVFASTGNAQADQDMLAWVRRLRWPIAKPDEKLRDTWFPMPIGFGGKQPPETPATCAAPPASNVR